MDLIKLYNQDEVFEQLETPKYNYNVIQSNITYPNITLGETYYKLVDKHLKAFKVLAIAFESYVIPKRYYLVQFPNAEPTWIEDFITHKSILFTSTEKFYQYMVGDSSARLELTWEKLVNIQGVQLGFRETWLWNASEGDVVHHLSHINYLVLMPNKLLIGFDLRQGFRSKEECIASHLNGMVITDFDEEETINIEINVQPKQAQVKTIHILEIS